MKKLLMRNYKINWIHFSNNNDVLSKYFQLLPFVRMGKSKFTDTISLEVGWLFWHFGFWIEER